MMNKARQEIDVKTTSKVRFEPGYQSLMEKVQNLDMELRAVSIGLQNKNEETEKLREQISQIIECLPIGAILFNHDRKILQINQAATLLLVSEGFLRKGLSLDDLWKELHIPPPPFSRYSYKGKYLKCWEEVIREAGLLPCLTIRLLSEDLEYGRHRPDAKNPLRADVDDSIAKVSHDLRNALASIELFASLVVRRPCNESEHHRLSVKLQQSVRSLEQFVTNMMSFSVSKEIHCEPVRLHSLFDQVEVMLSKVLESRRITIQRIVAPDAEVMEGDCVLLQRACLNVLHNAIAVTHEGGIVRIESRREKMASTSSVHRGDVVCIQVHDDGYGIKENDLSHVCESTFSKRSGGTGLGLSIVKDVVDAHQGTMNIQSHEGQGTTVSLSFPQQRRSA